MKYTGIAQTAEALAELLRREMTPEVVKEPERIGLCSPSERGNMSVGIWLYDIRSCGELQEHVPRTVDSLRQKQPPCHVSLYFMITAYSDGDARYQAGEEQRILGKVLQALKDSAVLAEASDEEKICSVNLLNLPMEEKMRIFNVPNMAYRTSLFYEVGPVEIESEKIVETARVVDVQFTVEEEKG